MFSTKLYFFQPSGLFKFISLVFFSHKHVFFAKIVALFLVTLVKYLFNVVAIWISILMYYMVDLVMMEGIHNISHKFKHKNSDKKLIFTIQFFTAFCQYCGNTYKTFKSHHRFNDRLTPLND